MSIAETIRNKITNAFDPDVLEVVDESAAHAGHAGSRPEGETHFRLTVVSAAFDGCSRVDRSRLVHEVLADELASRVHALSLRLQTPAEWQN